MPLTPLGRLPSRARTRLRHAWSQRRLARDLARIAGTRSARATEGSPVVGVATFGSGCWHLALEILLAHALEMRGARTELLLCDLPDLPACDERTIYSRDPDRCAGCLEDKRETLLAGGVPWRAISAFVEASAVSQAMARVSDLTGRDIDAFVHRGWPVGQWLLVSACHYLRADARGDTHEHVETRRRFLATAVVIVDAVERWLDQLRPDIVIAESGAHVMWRVAFELARARGIPVICREMGKGGWDCHLYALNADCMAPDLSESWTSARSTPLTPAQEAAVDRWLRELPARTYGAAPAAAVGDAAALRQRLGIAPGSRVAVLYTNVTWDLATAGRDVAFDGVADWVAATVDALRPFPEARLILRAHPAEAHVPTREHVLDAVIARTPLPRPQVVVVGPHERIGATHLAAAADVVLAYNSTVGLEAAATGRAVVVCGAPHYRALGFTHDVSSRSEYSSLMRAWAGGSDIGPLPGAVELARRYMHLFFLRYHIPLGWTTSPLSPPFTLLVQSADELRPGANRALDVICEAILTGRQPLLPGTGGPPS